MFTGLVQDVGAVVTTRSTPSGCELTVAHALGALVLGESICVNGCCLTVVSSEDGGHARGKPAGTFCADVTHQTLGRTTLGQLRPGRRVNLERSLRGSDLMGGHLVMGHVDSVARVAEVHSLGEDQHVCFEVPGALHGMLAPRGSVCVDGVSLTLTEAAPGSFCVTLIPHTRAVTGLGALEVGVEVNVEVDVIARYVAHALEVRRGGTPGQDEPPPETTLMSTLKKAGLL